MASDDKLRRQAAAAAAGRSASVSIFRDNTSLRCGGSSRAPVPGQHGKDKQQQQSEEVSAHSKSKKSKWCPNTAMSSDNSSPVFRSRPGSTHSLLLLVRSRLKELQPQPAPPTCPAPSSSAGLSGGDRSHTSRPGQRCWQDLFHKNRAIINPVEWLLKSAALPFIKIHQLDIKGMVERSTGKVDRLLVENEKRMERMKDLARLGLVHWGGESVGHVPWIVIGDTEEEIEPGRRGVCPMCWQEMEMRALEIHAAGCQGGASKE